TFCTLSSLLPGTLPTGSSQSDRLLIHCLDVGEPVVTQLAQEEALLIRAAGTARHHGGLLIRGKGIRIGNVFAWLGTRPSRPGQGRPNDGSAAFWLRRHCRPAARRRPPHTGNGRCCPDAGAACRLRLPGFRTERLRVASKGSRRKKRDNR